MLHGIAAYNKTFGVYSLIERVKNVLNGVEICTSNKAIGNIGISVDGKITGVFESDCWSVVDRKTGRRSAKRGHVFGYTGEISEEDIETIIAFHRDDETKYAEFWERDCSLNYIWVKESALDRVKKIARVIAKHFNIPCVTVSREYDVVNELVKSGDESPSEIDLLEERVIGY
jgi:hypothetical protein